jgi:sporulation protein YlmC with PRC-barrel domain
MAELPSERLFGDYGEWPGRDVLDSSGDRLGDVREIYLDRDTGRPEWVLVEVEDDEPRFVPLADASVESSAIRVAHPASVVRAAPSIGPEAHIDNDQERRLYEHYGIRYSETQSDSGLPANVTVGPAAPPEDVPPEDTATAEAAAAGAGPHAPVPGEEHAPAADDQATAEMPAASEAAEQEARWSGLDAPAADTTPAAETVPPADIAPAAETAPPPDAVPPEEPADAAPPVATPGLPPSGPPEPPAFAPEEAPATPGLPQPEPPAPPRAFPPPPPPPEPGGGKLALTGGKRRLGMAGGAALVAAALFLVVRRLRS